MIDVENELRQGTIYTPKITLHTPSDEDFDSIPIVSLGHTAGIRVRSKAEREAEQAKAELHGDFADQAYQVEFKRRLIYWSVVYGLAIDEKPAYQYVNKETGVKNDLNVIIDYVENRLGLHHEAFSELGLEVIKNSGLGFLIEEEKEIEL